MIDWIVIAIVVAIVGAALGYIIRAKRRGVHCIGCPDGGCCGASSTLRKGEEHCGGCGSCGTGTCQGCDTGEK